MHFSQTILIAVLSTLLTTPPSLSATIPENARPNTVVKRDDHLNLLGPTRPQYALSSGSPPFVSAIENIKTFANEPNDTLCGVDNGECTVFGTVGISTIGMCGPYGYSQSCESLVTYFLTIAQSCYDGNLTEGSIALNENADFSVWIVGQF